MSDNSTVKAEYQLKARKVYGAAMAVLRENHRPEFDDLLDAAYEAEGIMSPRQKRTNRLVELAAAKEASAVRREERRVAKIAKLQAELEALQGDTLL